MGSRAPLLALCGLLQAAVVDSMPSAAPTDVIPKCEVKASAAKADLASALDWVCGAGGVDCASIGGAHPDPTTAHADFAFDAYYQAHKTDGLDTCFFGGNAALVPPPAGHFLFTKTGTIEYPTPAKAGIGVWVTLTAGARHVFKSAKFDATYAGSGTPTFFSLWVAGSDGDQHMHVEVEYDLDGDANTDRTEVYKPRGMGIIPEYQAYTNALGLESATGEFGNMVGGTVTVTVISESKAGTVNFMMSTDSFPSFLTGPFN